MKELKNLNYYEELLKKANNQLVEKAVQDGQLALGYTCYFTPEVLLNLPGCFSVRLRAPGCTDVDTATYYMTNRTCLYARSLLESATLGNFDFLSALLGTETCCMMYRAQEHFGLLKLIPNEKFFLTQIDAPFITTQAAKKHYELQLTEKILRPLHEVYGVDTTDATLRQAVDIHNELCRVITEIGDMRKLDAPPITGYEFHVLQLVSQTCPQRLILPMLKETLEELKKRTPDETPWYRCRIVVAGGEIDDPEYTRVIEECGAFVVADRYCFGSLPGREEIIVKPEETALEAIARHYIDTNQCPRFMCEEKMNGRREYFKKLYEDYNADGVLLESMKFCEYWSYERVMSSYILPTDMNIPTASLEKEYAISSVGQLRTRVQAFVEALEIKKIQGKAGLVK